jgi:hypothetical protein
MRVLTSAFAVTSGSLSKKDEKKNKPVVVENTSIKTFKYSEVDGSTQHSYEIFPSGSSVLNCH